MAIDRKKQWNKHGKSRKLRQSEEERQIAELLDQADEQDLLRISAIHSSVSLPLPNQERLAWSVIDRADLADEEELERRKKFNQMLRRKKIIRAVAGCGIVAVILLILALCGVFDRFDLPTYETYYVASGCSFQGEKPPATLPKDRAVGFPSLEQEPHVDRERRDNTVYHALAEYCSANNYAVGEYRIHNKDYAVIDRDVYLVCDVLAECMDYQKKAGNKTWKDLGYRNVSMDPNTGRLYQMSPAAGELPKDVQSGDMLCFGGEMISIDENMPANVYVVYMTVYMKVQ